MASKASAPIGIFDSGIGGLTVAKAVRQLLPKEQIIYFGDTAHLPYGDKSTAAIQAYSVKIADVLLKSGCKLILIACNSASAAAFDLVKEYVASKALVCNVIDPVVDYLREFHPDQKVGLIGTKQTIHSGVYLQKVNALDVGITLESLATPLLVPMIEEGFHKNEVSHAIIDSYLSQSIFEGISALVLGCTHYPLIKNQISAYYQGEVKIIDSSEIVAKSVKALLEYHNLSDKGVKRDDQFMVSDFTPSFQHTTKLFFGEAITLEKYPLWE
ncbi:glutamate racemase [Pleomorphovibrio marinus]|uniref:glutamate racemase n=1 Tax=Pleomorphovibrio marinus TaxID=2164132 RepID=UPI000E0A9652|nr:glutamate racemase [Pleomorphovibrio marinus]